MELDFITRSDQNYRLKNRLGIPVQAWIELPTSYSDNVTLWDLQPRQDITFKQEFIDQIFPARDRTIGLNTGLEKAATIAIRPKGYQTVGGIIIEDLGTFAF
jgi:hypothetical protein